MVILKEKSGEKTECKKKHNTPVVCADTKNCGTGQGSVKFWRASASFAIWLAEAYVSIVREEKPRQA